MWNKYPDVDVKVPLLKPNDTPSELKVLHSKTYLSNTE